MSSAPPLTQAFFFSEEVENVRETLKTFFNADSEPKYTSSKATIKTLFDNNILETKLGINKDVSGIDLVLQSILSESLGYLPSFGVGELVSHQLSFILPIISEYHSENTESLAYKNAIEGKTLFSRIFYGEDGSLNTTKLKTTATKVGNEWKINGTLPTTLLSNDTDQHLVLARLTPSDEIGAFIVPADSAGLSADLHAPISDNNDISIAEVTLSNVTVGYNSALLHINPSFVDAMICSNRTLSALRTNKKSELDLNSIVEFLRIRTSNGVALINVGTLQQRLAALHAELSTSRSLSYRALIEQMTDGQYEYLANGSKYLSANLMRKISKEVIHLGGITHYRTDSKISQSYVESRWSAFFVEPSEVLLKNMLDNPQNSDQ